MHGQAGFINKNNEYGDAAGFDQSFQKNKVGRI
jgi:hypothetical protein